MSCIANDFGFDQIFARQVEALARKNDTLVVFTTSGKSPNIIAALKKAKEYGCTTVGMLGGDGGPSLELCDHAVVLPGNDSAAIQEGHQTLIHACCEVLETENQK
jgi:D-sedoheptulose 7-phosphate isomerase